MSLPAAAADVWDNIANSQDPVVVYGMGNAADRIADRLAEYGVEISDYFASDGFVRGHFFRGKRVLSYAEICEKYDNFTIVLAFASRLPDVIERILRYSKKHTLYAPDLPVCGDSLFDKNFYKKHYSEIVRVYHLLSDEESRKIYENVLHYKLSGDISYLVEAVSSPTDVWNNLLSPIEYRRTIDGGAYNGDTIRELLTNAPNLTEIIAAEPDPRTYKKLAAFAKVSSCAIECYNVALWSERARLPFSPKGNRGSAMTDANSGPEGFIQADTIDSLLDGRRADYIKLDVEGAEQRALIGAAKTISAHFPDLLISLYHRSEDIFALPLYLADRHPGYKLYLRRFSYIPAWDLNLYAVKKGDRPL